MKKWHTNRYLLVLVLAIGFTNMHVDASTQKPANKQNDLRDNQQSLNVKTKEFTSKTDLVNVDIRIPVIEGLTNNEFQNQLNASIEQQAKEEKVKIEKEAKELAEKAKQEGWEMRPLELTITYNVKNKEPILSFTVTTYAFTGGAHGVTKTDYYNINVNKNSFVTLPDLFKKNIGYKGVINEIIKKQIKKQEAAGEGTYFGPDDPNAFETISNDQSFYIQSSNLVIAFAQYEIAPGYMGEPTFSIPFSKLKDLLTDDYQHLVK